MAEPTDFLNRYKSQFGIRALLVVTALCALGLGWFVDRTRLKQQHAAEMAALKASHKYVLTVDGTPGVRLAMTLVTKPATKKAETITVPYSQEFEANETEVWIEYLPLGQSGNDGAVIEMNLSKDGVSNSFPIYRGTIQKDARKTVYVNGDMHWAMGDF